MVYHNKVKTPATQCHLMFLRHRSGCFSIGKFGMRLSRSYLKNWQQKLLKEKYGICMHGKYMHGNWKRGKNALRRIFMVKMFHTTCITIQRQCQVLTLYTKTVKTTIYWYMLKSLNTLMQKASEVGCWVIQIIWIIWGVKGNMNRKKTFVS